MIVCSMTSWKGRINTLAFAIYAFLSKQTIKPDKFVLTLSTAEFPRKTDDLPMDLQLIIRALNVSLVWIPDNIYCHKKYEVLKMYPDAYCIIIDDDIIYNSTYIETMMQSARAYPRNVICYYSEPVNYSHGKLLKLPFEKTPSFKNRLLSGLSCYPPNTYPLNAFNYVSIRDSVTPRCDDSWNNIWLIKSGIQIYPINEYHTGCLIDIPNTQEISIWKQYNSIVDNRGINKKYLNLVNVAKALHCESTIKQVWPDIFNC